MRNYRRTGPNPQGESACPPARAGTDVDRDGRPGYTMRFNYRRIKAGSPGLAIFDHMRPNQVSRLKESKTGMYNHIRGTIVHKSPSRVVIEAGGIGYDVTVPLSVSGRLPKAGSEAVVLPHLVVREDELRLIGFSENEERDLFRTLIGLSGVGPSMALQILSGMSPSEFALAVERQDAAALKKIKGVGEKTAKRIILELKGAKTVLPGGVGGPLPEGPAAEAVAALMALGLGQAEAVERVEKALREHAGAPVEELIKASLR